MNPKPKGPAQAPKGTAQYPSIRDIKYTLVRRENNDMFAQRAKEFLKLHNFIRPLVIGLNARKNPKLLFPVLKKTILFIAKECPHYRSRLHDKEQAKRSIRALLDKFKA